MENQIQEIKAYRKNKFAYYELMMSDIDNEKIKEYIEQIIPYYNRFLQIRAKDVIEQDEINYDIYGMDISSLKLSMIKNISSNENELCNICILLFPDIPYGAVFSTFLFRLF